MEESSLWRQTKNIGAERKIENEGKRERRGNYWSEKIKERTS